MYSVEARRMRPKPQFLPFAYSPYRLIALKFLSLYVVLHAIADDDELSVLDDFYRSVGSDDVFHASFNVLAHAYAATTWDFCFLFGVISNDSSINICTVGVQPATCGASKKCYLCKKLTKGER